MNLYDVQAMSSFYCELIYVVALVTWPYVIHQSSDRIACESDMSVVIVLAGAVLVLICVT